MPARTPDRNSIHAKQFCHEINPSSGPEYIAITPALGCEPKDCFNCVRQKVERAGGRIQYGWAIWEWPGVYIEGEHHAVWERSPGAPLIDITPSDEFGDSRRLFVRDDAAIYDFQNEGSRRDNRRRALNDDPLVEEFFRAVEAKVAILKSIPGIGEIAVDVETETRFEEAESEHIRLCGLLEMKYTPQNAPCPCGSGVKFKRCHGEPKKEVR
jgi:SEC-C motif